MRNVTKLKRLLVGFDISLSMDSSGTITLISEDKTRRISFLVEGRSITSLMDEALKQKNNIHQLTKK